MTAAAKKTPADGVPVAWENPLIPNKKLRGIYTAMVELRLLDEHLAKRSRRPRAGVVSNILRGQEGCRVSTMFDLKSGDLTSEGSSGAATSFLRGEKLAHILASAHPKDKSQAAAAGTRKQLPTIAKTHDRLYLAMGAALALKSARKRELLVAYVGSGELELPDWKPVLLFASEQALPVIFVVLPRDAKGLKQPGRLSLASSKWGVPGIPVDAADPVALYRVAQESMLRARAGGGPVLMECIRFQLAGQKAVPADPIETMRQFLLHRGIVDEAWLDGVETRFAARLDSVQ